MMFYSDLTDKLKMASKRKDIILFLKDAFASIHTEPEVFHVIENGEDEFVRRLDRLTGDTLVISAIDPNYKDGNRPNKLKMYSVDFWILRHLGDNTDDAKMQDLSEALEEKGDALLDYIQDFKKSKNQNSEAFIDSFLKDFRMEETEITWSANFWDSWYGYLYTIKIYTSK